MTYHIVLSRPTDLRTIRRQAEQGLNPRHSMAALADSLGATVHDGSGLEPSRFDRVIAALTRTKPLWWAIARKVRSEMAPNDAIFCTGEDIGIPVAALCGGRRGAHVAIMTHYIDRPKGLLAIHAFRLRYKVALFFTVAEQQAEFLRRVLKDKSKVQFVWDQTDTQFFSPAATAAVNKRPVIMSVGLEQRDYGTLASATSDLDVDVRISGHSLDTRVITRAFPATLPANMTRRFYPWPELQQLYQLADIVVVSLFPNNYAAGVQAFMEALASGKPVVVSGTAGLTPYFSGTTARVVPPGDAASMREAIVELLASPDIRATMGQEAVEVARHRFSLERYTADLSRALKGLRGR